MKTEKQKRDGTAALSHLQENTNPDGASHHEPEKRQPRLEPVIAVHPADTAPDRQRHRLRESHKAQRWGRKGSLLREGPLLFFFSFFPRDRARRYRGRDVRRGRVLSQGGDNAPRVPVGPVV